MNATTLKTLGVALALLMSAFAGYRYAAALYSEDIAALRADYAARAAQLEETYRAKERESAEALSAAWEARDRALADAVDLRGDVERVRREGDALRRELSRAEPGACDACRAKLAGCVGLLEEGSSLLAEGAALSQRIAADKDAVVRLR